MKARHSALEHYVRHRECTRLIIVAGGLALNSFAVDPTVNVFATFSAETLWKTEGSNA